MFKSLLNLFFPPICTGCNNLLLPNEEIICTICRHEIPVTQHHLAEDNEAMGKFYGRIDLQHASAVFYFHKKGIVQELIHNLKYRGHQEIGTMIAEWYLEDLKKINTLTTVDYVIPVPIHPRKLKSRGYNQVATFGQSIAIGLNLDYNDQILIRTKYTQTQSKKNLLDRSEGLQNTFDVIFSEKEHDKHFLLVDDVLTTGSTLEACCRALLKIPGTKISIVTMAMAQ